MNNYLKQSYFNLFFYKLLSEEYVCLKNVIEKVVQIELTAKYPKNDKDDLSKGIYKVLISDKNELDDSVEFDRSLKDYEMLSLIYADFRNKKMVTSSKDNDSKKLEHVKKIFNDNREEFERMYIEFEKDKYSLDSYEHSFPSGTVSLDENEYLFYTDRINLKKVDSLSKWQTEIKKIKQSTQFSLFYRGHSDSNYLVQPSITRFKSLLENESKLYEEMLIKNPKEFEGISIHLDILKKMQHYGLPTRLMDITQNILISLYFATEVNDDLDGEVIIFSVEDVKYTRSDNVTVLSSLAFCNHEMKKKILIGANNENDNHIEQFNDDVNLKKLLHEITSEKNFLPEIKPSTFKDNYFVLPTMDNERITRQSGCFIISALNKEKGKDINESRIEIDKKKEIYIIPHDKKKKLRQELDNFGINRSFVYPEISEVATYLKSKY